MDLYRLRTMLAPVLASLFLILSLCAFVVQRPASAGVMVPVVQLPTQPQPQYVCNHLSGVLWLNKNGEMGINGYAHPAAAMTSKIEEVWEYRVNPIYVVADSRVSYGQFVNFMALITEAAPKKNRIILLSGDLLKEVEHYPTFDDLCIWQSPKSPLWDSYMSPGVPAGR